MLTPQKRLQMRILHRHKDDLESDIDEILGNNRLSALLVNTSKQMPLIVNELYRRGLKVPVLVGGAANSSTIQTRIISTWKAVEWSNY